MSSLERKEYKLQGWGWFIVFIIPWLVGVFVIAKATLETLF